VLAIETSVARKQSARLVKGVSADEKVGGNAILLATSLQIGYPGESCLRK
jgi:hypothetical protein